VIIIYDSPTFNHLALLGKQADSQIFTYLWEPNLYYLETSKEIPDLLLDEFTYQGRVKIAKKYFDSTKKGNPKWTMNFINQFSKNYFSELGKILINFFDPSLLHHMFS
jgi:hypothetical protein